MAVPQAEHLPRSRPNTAIDYKRMIAKHVRPHFSQYTKVADVRFEDIIVEPPTAQPLPLRRSSTTISSSCRTSSTGEG